MKFIILCIASVSIASLAFGQTSTPASETSPGKSPGLTVTFVTATTVEGTVTSFSGDKMVVKTAEPEPMTFTVGKTVQCINKAGRDIEASTIKAGAHVHVYYDPKDETRSLTRIILDE